MLGGADKSNGDLGTYITGADTMLSCMVFGCHRGLSPAVDISGSPDGAVLVL